MIIKFILNAIVNNKKYQTLIIYIYDYQNYNTKGEKMFKKTVLVLGLSLFAFSADIVIKDAYVKQSMPNAKNSAIFMNIENTSDKDISLIDANSSYAKTTELHTHLHENGMMKMVRVKDIVIPAHSSVELKPKSLHIMLFDIKEPIIDDTKLDVKLKFDNNEEIVLKDIPSKAIKAHKHH